MTNQPIGATIIYRWLTESLPNEDCEGYVSFGEYIEANEQDSYGVNDDYIFYYCSQQELVEMLTQDLRKGRGDWQLVSIDEYHYEEE